MCCQSKCSYVVAYVFSTTCDIENLASLSRRCKNVLTRFINHAVNEARVKAKFNIETVKYLSWEYFEHK